MTQAPRDHLAIKTLTDVAGALLLLALDESGDGPSGHAQAPCEHIRVPLFPPPDASQERDPEGYTTDSMEFQDILMELRHAAAVQLPSRWSGQGDKVMSGSWVLESPAAKHPSKWTPEDHLYHLVQVIKEDAPRSPIFSKKGLEQDPVPESKSSSKPVGASDIAGALQSLKEVRADGTALLISSLSEGSTYQAPEVQELLARTLGRWVTVALPDAASQSSKDDLRVQMATIKRSIRHFLNEV